MIIIHYEWSWGGGGEVKLLKLVEGTAGIWGSKKQATVRNPQLKRNSLRRYKNKYKVPENKTLRINLKKKSLLHDKDIP